MNEIHLNDLYYTLQGEGIHWGTRALFVRMPYCNLACEWCDTSFNSHKPWTELDFLRFAESDKTRFAVVTGGEPMMHKHTPKVVKLLKSIEYTVAVETNGMFPIVDGVDFVTCSPKRQASPKYFVHKDVYDKVNEWKYVVDEQFDFNILDRHSPGPAKLSLSPEFTNFQVNVNKIIAYIVEHPEWHMSLQTHKWLGLR